MASAPPGAMPKVAFILAIWARVSNSLTGCFQTFTLARRWQATVAAVMTNQKSLAM